MEAPLTHFHRDENNVLKQKLMLLFPVSQATALFYFQKQGMVASLIHQFKYEGVVAIGNYLGQWLGVQLHSSPHFKGVTHIIPVPLHPKRQRKRGFNQAAIIAKKVGKITRLPVLEHGLVRVEHTVQLAKTGYQSRWAIIQDAFEIHPSLKNQKGHFLLIDDVITTGATLNACCIALRKYHAVSVSIATLAVRF